jgi:hypothetical protein
MIFWLKTRARWSERGEIERTDFRAAANKMLDGLAHRLNGGSVEIG